MFLSKLIQKPTYPGQNFLHYLTNVIKESMRLYPAVSFLGRQSAQEDSLGGHRIPVNTHVLTGIQVIHRSEKYWPDPNTFEPERFDNLSKLFFIPSA